MVGIPVHVLPAINYRLGETITVSGLLMAEDVIAQLEKTGYSDLIVLPRIMFDHPDLISLDDMTPMQVAKRLNCTITLAEQWYAMLDVHLTAPLRIFRAAAGFIREAARREAEAAVENFRKVVNISSIAGLDGNAGQINYAAGKAGIVGMTKSLAKEWGRYRVNVNAVAFGLIKTRLTDAAANVASGGLVVALA